MSTDRPNLLFDSIKADRPKALFAMDGKAGRQEGDKLIFFPSRKHRTDIRGARTVTPVFKRQGLACLRSAALSIACLGLLCFVLPTRADVVLPGILSDHMVLGKSSTTAVWGKADPGEQVTVSLAGQSASTRADETGRWRVALDLTAVGAGPHEMVVKGKNELRIQDIVIGDIWVASGQSNMQFTLRGALGAEEEIAASTNPMLRHFKVAVTPSLEPLEDCEGTWELAGPGTAGDFSAVGYFFGKVLQKELGMPIGIVNATLGGTAAESWTSPEGLRKEPELAPVAEAQWKAAEEYLPLREKWIAAFEQWTKTTERADRRQGSAAEFAAIDAPLDNWSAITLPGPGAGWRPGSPVVSPDSRYPRKA